MYSVAFGWWRYYNGYEVAQVVLISLPVVTLYFSSLNHTLLFVSLIRHTIVIHIHTSNVCWKTKRNIMPPDKCSNMSLHTTFSIIFHNLLANLDGSEWFSFFFRDCFSRCSLPLSLRRSISEQIVFVYATVDESDSSRLMSMSIWFAWTLVDGLLLMTNNNCNKQWETQQRLPILLFIFSCICLLFVVCDPLLLHQHIYREPPPYESLWTDDICVCQ